jgi:glycosyltransferase involved in cell wall biosynthesis
MPDSNHNGDVPRFSVIIAVFNDWGPLDACLRSLSEQTNFRDFEVIVVDDGSEHPAPDSIRRWSECYSLSIFREPHTGIAAARNSGIKRSSGDILVFTDADCRFEPDCLSALDSAISHSLQHECFQLHLVGDRSTLLGRAEDLRLFAIQDQTLQPDGRIRYLNTSGFAIRRSHPIIQKGPFDPAALRGEDTLLLATLIQQGELPFFIRGATIEHSVSLSITECLWKDARSAWLEGRTFEIIAAKRVRIRMQNRQRVRMLQLLWRTSRQKSIGREALMVLVARQALERSFSLLYAWLPHRPNVEAEMGGSARREG